MEDTTYNSMKAETSLINIIHPKKNEKYEFRDAYNNVVDMLNSDVSCGHAIGLFGLRRTGKTIMLNQLYNNSFSFGMKPEDIIYLSLSTARKGTHIDRNELDAAKLVSDQDIQFPNLAEVKDYLIGIDVIERFKCVFIDEVSLCEDFILAGKGFFDWLLQNGLKVVIAGTESMSLKYAVENSLFSRLVLIDISYISFKEYVRLKKLSVSTHEELNRALDIYVEHGNILDDTVDVDDKYLEDAVGINIALSIFNSNEEVFANFTHERKELVQAIIKYYKLLNRIITVERIKEEITSAELSSSIYNINKKHTDDRISMSKADRHTIAKKGYERFFEKYKLSFDKADIALSNEQLKEIDDAFSKLGLLYGLVGIPKDAANVVDVCLLHSLNYNLSGELCRELYEGDYIDNEELEKELADNIMSVTYGNILEDIVALKIIMNTAKHQKLLTCAKIYSGGFAANRVSTKYFLYRYSNSDEIIDDINIRTEIDLIQITDDVVNLIEIKKSDKVIPEQTRWLLDPTVQESIRNRIGHEEADWRYYVFYLGESKMVENVCYVNIPEFLLGDGL